MRTDQGIGDVRNYINVKALEEYLVNISDNQFILPLNIKQFSFGQSNPSYQLVDSKGRKYVLRTQPKGTQISKSAHRLDREYHIMRALKAKGFPVPTVYCLCDDLSILGTVFYVMEFVQGRIFRDLTAPELSLSGRWQCWKSALETLAQLHKIDPRSLELPTSFRRIYSSHFPRQINTLHKIHDQQASVTSLSGEKVGSIPEIDRILAYLSSREPTQKIAIVHGDYKIDNLIYHPSENRVIAILDWELCTIGHPLADIGNLLHPYFIPKELASPVPGIAKDNQVLEIKLIRRHLEIYRNSSGWDPSSDIFYGIIFAHFRLSIITQGIKARVLKGKASNENAAQVAAAFIPLAQLAIQGIETDLNMTMVASRL